MVPHTDNNRPVSFVLLMKRPKAHGAQQEKRHAQSHNNDWCNVAMAYTTLLHPASSLGWSWARANSFLCCGLPRGEPIFKITYEFLLCRSCYMHFAWRRKFVKFHYWYVGDAGEQRTSAREASLKVREIPFAHQKFCFESQADFPLSNGCQHKFYNFFCPHIPWNISFQLAKQSFRSPDSLYLPTLPLFPVELEYWKTVLNWKSWPAAEQLEIF